MGDMRRCIYIVLIVSTGACSATDVDPGTGNVANPQPIPVPGAPDADRIFLSRETEKDEVFAAGAPDSVEPEVDVWIENIARDERFSAEVTDEGSFLMQIKWATDETLRCWAQRKDKQGPKVELLLPDEPSIPPPSLPLEIEAVSPVVDGRTTITGTIEGDSTLIVANEESGATIASTYDEATDFSVEIAASAGDRLLLFSVGTKSRRRKSMYQQSVPQP